MHNQQLICHFPFSNFFYLICRDKKIWVKISLKSFASLDNSGYIVDKNKTKVIILSGFSGSLFNQSKAINQIDYMWPLQGTLLTQIKFSMDIFSFTLYKLNWWYIHLSLHTETFISATRLINANVWIQLPFYLLPAVPTHLPIYTTQWLTIYVYIQTEVINSAVQSCIQMTMNNISATEAM